MGAVVTDAKTAVSAAKEDRHPVGTLPRISQRQASESPAQQRTTESPAGSRMSSAHAHQINSRLSTSVTVRARVKMYSSNAGKKIKTGSSYLVHANLLLQHSALPIALNKLNYGCQRQHPLAGAESHP